MDAYVLNLSKYSYLGIKSARRQTFHIAHVAITVISIACSSVNSCIILTRDLGLLERELDMVRYSLLVLNIVIFLFLFFSF